MLWQSIHIRTGADFPVTVNHFTMTGPNAHRSDLHEEFEVLIVLEGEFEFHLEGTTKHLKPGEVALAAGWEWHGWRYPGGPRSALVVFFTPDFLKDETPDGFPWQALFTAPPEDRPQPTTRQERENICALALEMAREYELKLPCWQTAVRLGLLRTLLTLYRVWPPDHRLKKKAESSATELMRIMPAIRLAGSRLHHWVTTKEAAAACAVSVSHFCYLFRGTTGLSFGDFMRRTRLSRAAQLLRHTEMSVEAIAQQMGFVDGSHLSRSFKRAYGDAPGKYRHKHLEEGESSAPMQPTLVGDLVSAQKE